MAVAAMVTSISSIEACAYINEYSTDSRKESSKSIFTNIYAKNLYNSYTDFYGHANYYNNSTNVWIGSKGSIHYDVPSDINEAIYFTWTSSSTLPSTTRVEISCGAYTNYNPNVPPYETFTTTDYVYY